MKIFTVLFLIILSFCSVKKNSHKKEILIFSFLGWQSQQCRNYYGTSNTLFFSDEYLNKYTLQTPLNLSIIGDSTMDISSRYSGWMSSSTVSFAVSGNTLCDMYEQNINLNKTYKNVLIASNGGNDILRKIPNDIIIQTFKQLSENIRKTGSLTVIGIHPVRVDYANKQREYINSQIKIIVENIKGCYIDPSSLFTLDSDGRTVQEQMLDSIHYNQTKSFEIKNLVKNNCNIQI